MRVTIDNINIIYGVTLDIIYDVTHCQARRLGAEIRRFKLTAAGLTGYYFFIFLGRMIMM